jgi:hypothetical protein
MLPYLATDFPLRTISFHQEEFSMCEAYNLRLDTELTHLQADNLQLCKQITTTHDQERAALI